MANGEPTSDPARFDRGGIESGEVDPVHARLAAALRSINETLIAYTVPDATVAWVAQEAERLSDLLNGDLQPRPVDDHSAHPLAGRRFGTDAMTGAANVVAPPMRVWEAENEMHAVVTFGATYEGPPGCVHGGFIAAAFDHILGSAQHLGASQGMTALLSVRYRKPTPLHREAHLRARVERKEGRKLFIAATLHVDGVLCADAEGLFIAVDFVTLRRAERHRAAERAASSGI